MTLSNIVFGLFDKGSQQVVHECAELMVQSEPWVTLKRSYRDVVEIINDSASEVHVARSDNQIIGFAIIKLRGAFVGYIQSIVIKPKHRGQGIGRAFIEYLEERIFSEHPNVFICVSSFNLGAKKLYDELGYATVGELKDYIVKGYSEILMRKNRAPLTDYIAKKK